MSAKQEKPDPEPPQDPKLGDKTPSYMEWHRRNHPEQHESKYRGRKISQDAEPAQPGKDIPEVPMDKPEEHWGPHQ